MRAQMLRCAPRWSRSVTLVAQKGGNVLRAPCSVSGTNVSAEAVQVGANFWGKVACGHARGGGFSVRFSFLRCLLVACLLALSL